MITVGALEQLRNITNIVTDADGNNERRSGSRRRTRVRRWRDFRAAATWASARKASSGGYKPDVVAPGTFVISTRSAQWATNAYYNPTNDNVTTLSDLLQPHTQTDPPLQFFVFNNAIGVDITADAARRHAARAAADLCLAGNRPEHAAPGS